MPRHLDSTAATIILALTFGLAQTPAWAAEPPGRYTMSPAVGGGFVRLDTQTGQMSLCNRTNAQWTCTAMADEGRGLATEVEKLRTENERLRAEVHRLDDMVLGSRPGQTTPPGANGHRLELPSEQDVDRAMTYMQRMFKKFQDKLKEFEPNGTPKPKQPPATPL